MEKPAGTRLPADFGLQQATSQNVYSTTLDGSSRPPGPVATHACAHVTQGVPPWTPSSHWRRTLAPHAAAWMLQRVCAGLGAEWRHPSCPSSNLIDAIFKELSGWGKVGAPCAYVVVAFLKVRPC